MVSHELRGPISTIKGLAVTSRTYYDQLPDEEKREFLELIEQESDRMLEIVKQASLAMKLSAGVLTMEMGPADLAAIVREGVGAAGLGDDRRVDLELEDVTIECDRARLVEVIRQVVQNAGTLLPARRAGRGLAHE
jgi:signal transduction histidine kinase